MKGEILTNSNKDVKRRYLDFYPTPNEVTEALIKSFRIEKQLIWECACGIGNMSKVLKKYNDVISTDISENSYGETNIDFLKTYRVSDWIITNPPFKLSSLFILEKKVVHPQWMYVGIYGLKVILIQNIEY